MPEDPTSQYVWWAPLKDLQLRRLMHFMMPQNLTPRQKRRLFWIYAVMLLVYVLLVIYILVTFTRVLGQ